MSLFGAMSTAISGLTAQSRALGNVSDNVANSQTVGFKRIDTNFIDYLTTSTETINTPGTVVAAPDYRNSIQGTVEQSDNPLSMAVSGQGFFSVSQRAALVDGEPVFDRRQMFTRAGDFRRDEEGYLVNGQGYYLQGWRTDVLGNPDRSALAPVRIDQSVFNPVATSRVELAANLPADAATGTALPTQLQAYDALGGLHNLDLTWTKTGANVWNLAVTAPGGGGALGSADVNFGTANGAPAGTVGSLSNPSAGITVTNGAAGSPATVTFNTDYGQGTQPVTLSLGAFGDARGLTQFTGESYALRSQTQDGAPLGSFAGVGVQDNGDVAVKYDNGRVRTIAKVPLVAFNDPDRLERLDGQAFVQTAASGEPRVTEVARNGAGSLTVGAVERSNVDIAAEFSKLIVAQRAYTANTKIVTASDEMLQDVINMRR